MKSRQISHLDQLFIYDKTKLKELLYRQGFEYADSISCKGVRPSPLSKNGCPGYDTKLHLSK